MDLVHCIYSFHMFYAFRSPLSNCSTFSSSSLTLWQHFCNTSALTFIILHISLWFPNKQPVNLPILVFSHLLILVFSPFLSTSLLLLSLIRRWCYQILSYNPKYEEHFAYKFYGSHKIVLNTMVFYDTVDY